ncbi:MAG: class II aldolase/adducin family protein [Burkholderiaceae bacterium]|nr:class II aldolase/adducin family protein [Burkholderiaceae bacterium]
MSAHDGTYRTEDDARAALVASCLRMNAIGINQGRAGNQSLRWNRGAADGMLITPSALAYEEMLVDDIVWLALAATRDAGGEPAYEHSSRAPSSEWRVHRDIYLHRPDAAAIVHAHSPHASALACTARVQRHGIPAFHYMVAIAGGADLRCAPYATFGTQQLSTNALAALDARRACLLANHGLLALGESLVQALGVALEVETLARMYALALALGDPVVLGDDEMARVLARFSPYV